MNSKTVEYGLIALLLVLIPCNMYAKKKYTLIDTTIIYSMEKLKFDIESFEKNRKRETWEYTKEDGTFIWQYKYSGDDYYIEKEYPPVPKLYYIYREYYLNGDIKTSGFMIRTAFPISIWKHYDEQGDVTEENMDARLGKFDYNQVILFLDKEKHINIKTGKGREDMTIGFNEEGWHAKIWPSERNGYKPGMSYILDKDTGKVKKKTKLRLAEE